MPKSVSQVVEEARVRVSVVMTLKGEEVVVEHLRSCRSGTIAIIGPTEIDGIPYSHSLLCEIGLGKSRPYHAGNMQVNGERHWVPSRPCHAQLSPEQYKVVAPYVFSFLQELTDERVGEWKEPLFYVPMPRNYMSRHQKQYLWSNFKRPCVRGVRFSVPRNSFFVGDIYHAELFGNNTLRNSIGGLARYIDLVLNHHYRNRWFWRGKRAFEKLVHVQECQRIVKERRLPRRHMELLLESVPGGKRNHFYPYLAYLWGIDGEVSPERKLARAAGEDAPHRYGSMQLSIVRKYKSCLVFEVFPTQKTLEQRSHGYTDEVPF